MISRNQYHLPLNDPTKPFPKRSPALTDTDKMPFGVHKGKLMQDVPASYLAWLWTEKCNNQLVANYIWNSFDAINQDLSEDKKILR